MVPLNIRCFSIICSQQKPIILRAAHIELKNRTIRLTRAPSLGFKKDDGDFCP